MHDVVCFTCAAPLSDCTRALQEAGFVKTSIFRPSILITPGHTDEKLRTKVSARACVCVEITR